MLNEIWIFLGVYLWIDLDMFKTQMCQSSFNYASVWNYEPENVTVNIGNKVNDYVFKKKNVIFKYIFIYINTS